MTSLNSGVLSRQEFSLIILRGEKKSPFRPIVDRLPKCEYAIGDQTRMSSNTMENDRHPYFECETQTRERPEFWETISISNASRSIERIVNGQQRRLYDVDHPDYDMVIENAKRYYPQLAPGRICYYYRFADGREKVETKNFD